MREIKPSKALSPLAGHLWEQFILPAHLHSNEVLWSPANTSPWILRRQAVTLHDASVFDHPEWFKSTFGAWTRLSWKVLAKGVKAILTVSNFSRERLQHHLRIPDERIHVIPNGVGRPFEPKSAKVVEGVRTKYKLTKPYFLFVGTHEPRKNLDALLRAWESFGASGDYTLAIAGTEGIVFAPAGQIAKSPEGDNSIHKLGYVPDSDLPALYSGTSAVVVPSLYEGFGLSALEAMACGAPVIASNTSAFTETVGDAGILVQPDNTEEIADAMHRITKDRALANTLRERGLKRAKQFSWDESAHRIQSLVESL